MSRPKVAIVGSVDETRVFDPRVAQPALARRACEELGRELAEAGWDLLVYSADRSFIEADVVHGYIGSGKAAPASIHVRAPFGKRAFDEISDNREFFNVRADPSRDWEVSFYRSLADSQGVLLVGGGRSTLITGLIALTIRIPIVTVATFGGNAKKVWEHLANERNDATEGDIFAMADDWRENSAQRLVQILVAQQKSLEKSHQDDLRRARRELRRANTSLAVAALLLLVAVAGLTVAWGWRPGTAGSIAVLVMLPTLAAAAGALIRTSLDAGGDWARAGVLGGAAGLITGLLYVASQFIGAPQVLQTSETEGVHRLLFFVLPIGFITGLTFDAIYAKLRGADVSQVHMFDNI
jgi:hypothetical protein